MAMIFMSIFDALNNPGSTCQMDHRQTLTVDWKLWVHGGWIDKMVRKRGLS